MSFFSRLLDLIYPPAEGCLFCGAPYFSTEIYGLCRDCIKKIVFIDSYCPGCGRAMDDSGDDLCRECKITQYYFDFARSTAIYTGLLRELIFQLKYDHFLELQQPLCELLHIYFKYYFQAQRFDYIVPVPLHQKRLLERGFNQAELLAKGLAWRTGIPLLAGVIRRVKNNPPLYQYTPVERKNFIKGSFLIEPQKKGLLKEKRVLLVDDILTTGTTVNELSYLLKKTALVNSVKVLTLASVRMF